jgi:hypothetical protein
MVAVLCRNGLHPVAMRRRNGRSGRPACYGCRDERQKLRRQLAPGGRADWADPVEDAAARDRAAVWAAGVDDAIAAIRKAEGFDGRLRGWQTLGDVEGMQEPVVPEPETAPAPAKQPWQTRPIIACPGCGGGRFEDQACAHCPPARLQRFQIAPCGRCGVPKYAGAVCGPCADRDANRRRRFQEQAAQDVGALFDLNGRELIRG